MPKSVAPLHHGGENGEDGDGERTDPVKVIDARHLACPLPVLKARKALLQMAAGKSVTVLATDPAALRDFSEFARTAGHELVEFSEEPDGVLRFVLRRG